ncbi:hypothetical protein [Gorillibacterium timonense]|uniref:hypothetical protein n=1 Tax=Gorillibacterium timonense TaxID=1689269 RepID=UPI00071D8E65|nr:hypothetical protein [Gorillibacterium timonense]
MNEEQDQWERALKQAFRTSAEPPDELNRRVIDLMKEREAMKTIRPRKRVAVLLAAAITLALSATAIAATHLLDSKQVVEQMGNPTLAAAFAGKDAIKLDQSAESGGYTFTLHGIVSGKSLSDFAHKNDGNVISERTYAVVSIARADGKPMPSTRDEEYGTTPFFVSPLIKGVKPWQVNIASMKGGYSELVVDGIQYRLIECDDVEKFADRGLYLAVSTGSFYDIHSFTYDEATGAIALNPDFEGAHALFSLPIDSAKADPAKAAAYLDELLNPKKAEETAVAPKAGQEPWREDLAKGTVVPASKRILKEGKDGMLQYDYPGHSLSVLESSLFTDGQTGESAAMSLSGSEEDGNYEAIRFSRDEKGVVTAWIIKFHSEHSIAPEE